MVVGFLYGKTRCESDAEDVAQEVFLTAYRGLVHLRDSDRVGPWLMRIVRSRLIDHYRRAGRRPQVVTDPCSEASPEGSLLCQMAEPSPHPGQLAVAAQTRQIILEEIAGMKENYRDILYWRLLGEETSDAIARRLGLRESAVRMRLFRGMRLLRKALKKHGLGPESMD
jgi:RNA polymerase sigma-70 factor (ECF subfamily)